MKKLKLIKIVLNLDAMSIASTGKAKIAYEITVFTGDEAEAGLEHGDVYITVCGETKNLSDLKLQRTGGENLGLHKQWTKIKNKIIVKTWACFLV